MCVSINSNAPLNGISVLCAKLNVSNIIFDACYISGNSYAILLRKAVNTSKDISQSELTFNNIEFNKGYYVGHSSNFIKVLIETNKKLNSNDIVKVDVLKAYDSYVLAKIKGE